MSCSRAAARERPVASNTDIDPADGPEDPGPFIHRIACTVRLPPVLILSLERVVGRDVEASLGRTEKRPCPRIHHRRPGEFRLSQTGLLDPRGSTGNLKKPGASDIFT